MAMSLSDAARNAPNPEQNGARSEGQLHCTKCTSSAAWRRSVTNLKASSLSGVWGGATMTSLDLPIMLGSHASSRADMQGVGKHM